MCGPVLAEPLLTPHPRVCTRRALVLMHTMGHAGAFAFASMPAMALRNRGIFLYFVCLVLTGCTVSAEEPLGATMARGTVGNAVPRQDARIPERRHSTQGGAGNRGRRTKCVYQILT